MLDKLRSLNLADIEEQGFMPLYTRQVLIDDSHNVYSFHYDFRFVSKSKMLQMQKLSKER